VAARAALGRRFWATVPARLRLLRAATVSLTAALAALLLVAGLAANGAWDSVADRDAPRTPAPPTSTAPSTTWTRRPPTSLLLTVVDQS
jgi:hypothetical protein